MSKKCFVKFKFINAFKGSLAFKRALQELGISEEGFEIESYEQLSSKIVSLLSKLLSEQQAFFSLYGTDSFASIDNVDLRGQFLNKPALAQAVKEQEAKLAADLRKLFEEAESGNGSIDLILSKFITNDILSTVLSKLDHYEKNKHKYSGAVATTVEGYLVKTLNWLSIALEDEKAKNTPERLSIKKDIHAAVLKINQYLNNQVKFAFPLYVQIPFGSLVGSEYIDNFYIDSESDESSEMVSNPINREITQSIISVQAEKLRKGSIESFGIARAYQVSDVKTEEIEKLRQEELEEENGKIVTSSELYQDSENNYYKVQKLGNGKTRVIIADESGRTLTHLDDYDSSLTLDNILNGKEGQYGNRKGTKSELTITKIKDLKYTNKIVDKINAKYDAMLSTQNKTIFKLFRAMLSGDEIIYSEVTNEVTGTLEFDYSEGHLFKPELGKVSPFSVNGESDFTNFISNFDGIIPKRIGDKKIVEHDPESLKIHISKNVSVDNNVDIQIAINSILDALRGKKGSIFSSTPAFLQGRERFLEGKEDITEYKFVEGEFKEIKVDFDGIVTKGLNNNIDIILFSEDDNGQKTFVGDFDPMSYVMVTASGAEKVSLDRFKEDNFIIKYFSLTPGIRINDTSLRDALIQDLNILYEGNKALAADRLQIILTAHKGVIPLQFLAEVNSALINKSYKSNVEIFLNKTIDSFRFKASVIEAAEKQFEALDAKTTKGIEVTPSSLGLSGHHLEVHPNINQGKDSYSENFDFGGEYNGYKVFTWKTSSGETQLEFFDNKEKEFLNTKSEEYGKLASEVNSALKNQSKYRETDQITLLYYSGDGSRTFVPMFMSVKPLSDEIKDDFIFSGALTVQGEKRNTKVRVSVPINKASYNDSFKGGFDNKTLLRVINQKFPNTEDISLEFKYNILGLSFATKEEVDAFFKSSGKGIDPVVLEKALTDYYFKVLDAFFPTYQKANEKVLLKGSPIIDELNKTFLRPSQEELNSGGKKSTLGLKAKGTVEKLYSSRPYIAQKMKIVAEAILSIDNKEFFESVTEKDFKENTALTKLRHNINTSDPVNRVLKFDKDVSGDSTESDINGNVGNVSFSVFEEDPEVWEQRESEFTYTNDRSLDSLNDRKRFLNKVAGTIAVDNIDNVKDRLDKIHTKNVNLGVVMDSIVYMNEQLATQGNFYHEAAHRVFDYLLTEEEQVFYLSEAKALPYSESHINKFLINRGLVKNDKNIELFYREQIMNLFAQYRLKKDNASFISLIGYWLKNLFDTIKDWLNIASDPSLNQLFRDIDKGKYRNRTAGKVEPLFQNLVTKNLPLDTESTENLFYHLYGALISNPTYSKVLDNYKLTRSDKFIENFLTTESAKVHNWTTKIDSDNFPQTILDVLKVTDNLTENVALFKEFIDERVFENNFNPDDSVLEELSEEEILRDEVNEAFDETPKDTGYNKSKYNEEVFIEPKVKSFVSAVVSHQSVTLGVAKDKPGSAPIMSKVYKKINNKIINKAQKDFSVAPIGADTFQHFLTFLDGFARYDKDYEKLRDAIYLQFEVTKADGIYQVGKNSSFLLGLIKNFSQNRIYYSKVIIQRKGAQRKVFGSLDEQELILDKNGAKLNNIFSKIGRVPSFNSMNIVLGISNNQKFKMYKENNEWFQEIIIGGVRTVTPLTMEAAKAIFETRFSSLGTSGIANVITSSIESINASLNKYKRDNLPASLDEAVDNFGFIFSVIGIPVNPSYAYLNALNSVGSTVDANKIDTISAFNDLVKTITSPDYKSFFDTEYSRMHPSHGRFLQKIKTEGDVWFHALINGSNLSYNSVKGVEGKSYYAYSYNNITSKLELDNDVRFDTNNILRYPYFRVANMMVNQGIKKEFKDLTEDEIFAYILSLYTKGYYNLDQLEANSTNFSVKATQKDYVMMSKNVPGFELTKEKLGYDLAEQYRDVAASMGKLISIYEEAQELLNEVDTDLDRKELLDYINEKYDLALGVSALSLSDLDKSIITDRAYNKLGFNTFFNILPVVQFKTKQEVLEYEELVKTEEFEQRLVNAVLGDISKPNHLGGLAGNIWKERISNSKVLDVSQINLEFDGHYTFIANMAVNYLVQTHKIYKKILGEHYFHAFKSSNTGEFNKRLKALAIFGQDIDQGRFVEADDIIEVMTALPGSEWKQDNSYMTSIKEAAKDGIESTDGAGLITFERAIQVQKSKSRLDDQIISYYVSLLTDGRFVYDNTVKNSSPDSIAKVNSYAKKSNAVSSLFKTALGASIDGKFRYHKMAYMALPRGLYTRLKKDTTKEQINDAYLQVALATVAWLNDYSLSEAKISAYEKLYSLLEPVPGQERVFDIYKNMETNNIQATVFRSASKAYKTDNTIEVFYGAEKHQTENTNYKDKITVSTQAAAGIIGDQNPETAVWNGKTITKASELIKDFIKTRSNLSDLRASVTVGSLVKNGEIDVEMLSYFLKRYVTITRNKEHLESLFDTTNKKGKVTFNLAPDNPEAIPILLTLIAKIINDVNSSKVKGDSYGIVPSVFYSVQEDENGYVPMSHRSSSEGFRTLQPRQMIHNNGTWVVLPFINKQEIIDIVRGDKDEAELPIMEVHEMVIPAHEIWQQEYLLDRAKMREGFMSKADLDSKYPLELFLVYGTRIPHEEKRSAVVGLVVDFLPANVGSVVLMATAKMKEDGHDNDNDKLYASKFHVTRTAEGWRIKSKPTQTVWQRVKKNSFLKHKIERELSLDKEHVNNRKQIEKSHNLITYFRGILSSIVQEELNISPLVEDMEMRQGELEISILQQLYDKIIQKDESLLDAAFEEVSGDTVTVSEIFDQYYAEINNLGVLYKQFNQRKSRLITEQVNAVTKFSESHGIDLSLDSEVEENNLLYQFMSLHSNKHTLETGLIREQTNLDHATDWTKNELNRVSTVEGYNIIGSPLRVARNIFKTAEGGQGISVQAKFIKTLPDLKNMDAKLGKVTLLGKSVSKVTSSRRFVKEGVLFVEKLNERIEKYNKTAKVPMGYVNVDTEYFKLNNLKGSLYVSVATDAIKNQFGIGLNLNKLTHPVYYIGVSYNLPQAMLMAICTSPYVRSFTSLEEVKVAANELRGALVNDSENKPIKVPPLLSEDILNLYFDNELKVRNHFIEYEHTIAKDENNVPKVVMLTQPDGKKKMLNELGVLRLQALEFLLKMNDISNSLFSISSFTNSDKAQQIDSHLATASLMNSPYNNTIKSSPSIGAVLGVGPTQNFTKKTIPFKYKQGVPDARKTDVKYTGIITNLFRPYTDMDIDSTIASELSEMLNLEIQNYNWFANIALIAYNSNASYDVTKLPELKEKLETLNAKHNNTLMLINRLRWENGIFFMEQEDKTEKDIITIKNQLSNIDKSDYHIISELLRATRYIYGWKDGEYTPFNYFPGNILALNPQKKSSNIKDYIPELERQLLAFNTTLKAPYFPKNLPVPVKGGTNPTSEYLDPSFDSDYKLFKLVNLPSGTQTLAYMSKGTNIYKKVSEKEYKDSLGIKRKEVVYALLQKVKTSVFASQAFNPFFQSRLTNLDVFNMQAEHHEIDINNIPFTMIYNNLLIMQGEINDGNGGVINYGEKSAEKDFLGKITTFNYNKESGEQATGEIGLMNNYKKINKLFSGELSSSWEGTIFNEMATQKRDDNNAGNRMFSVHVFEATTNFPKDTLVTIQNGKVSYKTSVTDKAVQETFKLAPQLDTVLSNVEVSDLLKKDKSSEEINNNAKSVLTEERISKISEELRKSGTVDKISLPTKSKKLVYSVYSPTLKKRIVKNGYRLTIPELPEVELYLTKETPSQESREEDTIHNIVSNKLFVEIIHPVTKAGFNISYLMEASNQKELLEVFVDQMNNVFSKDPQKLSVLHEVGLTINLNQEALSKRETEVSVKKDNKDKPEFDKLPAKSPIPTMTYAGIGSRETPVEVLEVMTQVSGYLDRLGYTLHTGFTYRNEDTSSDEEGADKAFSDGSKNKALFGPYNIRKVSKGNTSLRNYSDSVANTSEAVVNELHPAPSRLSAGAKRLMKRNTNQIFGENLDTTVDFVLFYAQETSNPLRPKGGTGQAVEMARRKGIPTINMADANWRDQFKTAIANKPAQLSTKIEDITTETDNNQLLIMPKDVDKHDWDSMSKEEQLRLIECRKNK